ncbi:MAG: AI-2E family transporter [Clostridia bacterium]|nr:AI-2E family transporter [Clostridia bacterium]
MKKPASDWIKLVLAGTALILIYKLLNNFNDITNVIGIILGYISPCIIGTIIAFFLYIPSRKLESIYKKVPVKGISNNAKVFGTLSVYIIIFLALSLFITYLVPRLYKNIEELISNVPRYLDIVNDFVSQNKYLAKLNISTFLDDKISGILDFNQINKYFSIIKNIASSFINIFISIVFSIYIILEKENIVRYLRQMRKSFLGERFYSLTLYGKKIVNLVYSYFSGLALDALVVGIIVSIGFSILKMPYALLLGLVTFLGNMIPIFGPIISTVIIITISLISNGVWGTVPVAIFIVVLYVVDSYLIQPKIVANSIGIRPLLVMVAVIVFGDIFGFVGMIIGVPLIATLKMIMDDYLEDGKIDGANL